jgi:hypothetical protein
MLLTVLGDKPVQVPFCLSQVLKGLYWDQTQASKMETLAIYYLRYGVSYGGKIYLHP